MLGKKVNKFRNHMSYSDHTNLSFIHTHYSVRISKNKDRMSFSLTVPELIVATIYSFFTGNWHFCYWK